MKGAVRRTPGDISEGTSRGLQAEAHYWLLGIIRGTTPVIHGVTAGEGFRVQLLGGTVTFWSQIVSMMWPQPRKPLTRLKYSVTFPELYMTIPDPKR